MDATPSHPLETGRLKSLDAYRGFVLLVLAFEGGLAHLRYDPTWGWLAEQFEHRAWEGCSFWDLVQPSFLFVVGVAMAYSVRRRTETGQTWGEQFLHVVNRSLILIALGIFLDSYRTGELVLSFVLVLQQIAIAQLLAFFFVRGKAWVQVAAAVAVLGLHTCIYVAYGQTHGTEAWSRGMNAGAALDRILHLPYFVANGTTGNYPEGQTTLNALSSTATILFGVLAGKLLQSGHGDAKKALVLLLCGLAGLGLGTSLAPLVPIVKPIWTASFTLFAGGWTFLLMALFYLAVDVMRVERFAFPMVVAGMNSIFLYVLSNTLTPQLRHAVHALVGFPLSRLGTAGPVITMGLVVCLEWSFCYWLYRRGIFFKI